MKLLITIMVSALAGTAVAADFPGLPAQLVNPGAIWQEDPFPQHLPALDSCAFMGLKDGVCRFKCESGDVLEMKPVKPGARDPFEACGTQLFRGGEKSLKTMEDWRSVDLEAADGTVISVDYVAYDLGGKITATRVWVSVRNPALKASDRVTAKLSNYYEATSYSQEALQKADELELPFNGWNFQAKFPGVSIYEAHHSWHHDFVQEISVKVNGKPLAAKTGSFRFRMEGPSSSRRSLAGSISGRMGGAPVQLLFYALEGRIAGKLNNSPVDVAIDKEGGKISGSAHGSAVDITLYDAAGREGVRGEANGAPVDYKISWEGGNAEGWNGKEPFLIMWKPEELEDGGKVELSGYVNHAVLELSYDRASGRITGQANHGRVDIKLSGWGLRDFIRYYFIFMKPRNL